MADHAQIWWREEEVFLGSEIKFSENFLYDAIITSKLVRTPV